MQDQNALKQGLQQEPIQDKPQQEVKKKQSPLLIILAVLLMLIFTGLVGYVAYILGKNAGKEEGAETTTDTTTEDEDEEDDETTTSDETTEEETDTSTSATPDPYKGWKTYENNTCSISFKYPSDWEIDDSKYSDTGTIWVEYSNDDSIYLYLSGCFGGGQIFGHGWCADDFVPIQATGCGNSFSTEDKESITINEESEELIYCKLSGITLAFLLQISTGNETEDMYEIGGHAGTKEIETVKKIMESLTYQE